MKTYKRIFVTIFFYSLFVQSYIISLLLQLRRRKENILVFADFAQYGGTRTYFERLVSILIKNKNKIHVVISSNQIQTGICEFLIRNKCDYSIQPEFNFCKESSLINYYLHNLFFLYLIITKRINQLIISAGSGEDYLIHSFAGLKTRVIIHNIPSRKLRYTQALQLKLIMYFNKFKIIAVSDFQKKEINRLWLIQKKKIMVIHNTSFMTYSNSYKSKKTKILTVGHVVDYKSPDVWLDVARKIIIRNDNVEFSWIGDGPLLEKFRKIGNDLSRNIKFIGACNQREIRGYYEEADLYLQLSRIENLSISVLDALALGIPCIVSNVGAQGELVINNETGYIVNLNNTDKIVDRILNLISDDQLLSTFSQNTRVLFNKKFSPLLLENSLINMVNES